MLGRRVRRFRRVDVRRWGKRGRVWVVRSRLLRRRRRGEGVAVEGVTMDVGDERVSRNAQIVSVFCFDY